MGMFSEVILPDGTIKQFKTGSDDMGRFAIGDTVSQLPDAVAGDESHLTVDGIRFLIYQRTTRPGGLLI